MIHLLLIKCVMTCCIIDIIFTRYLWVCFCLQVGQSEYSSEMAAAKIHDVQEGMLLVSFKYPDRFDDDFVNKINMARSDSHFLQDAAFKNLKIEVMFSCH